MTMRFHTVGEHQLKEAGLRIFFIPGRINIIDKLYSIAGVLRNGTKLSIFPSKPWTWNKKIPTFFECSDSERTLTSPRPPVKVPHSLFVKSCGQSTTEIRRSVTEFPRSANRSPIKTVVSFPFGGKRRQSDINVAHFKSKKNSGKNCYPIGSNKVSAVDPNTRIQVDLALPLSHLITIYSTSECPARRWWSPWSPWNLTLMNSGSGTCTQPFRTIRSIYSSWRGWLVIRCALHLL